MTENKFNKQRNSVFSFVVVLGIVCVLIGLILLAFNFGDTVSKSVSEPIKKHSLKILLVL